MKLQLNFIKNLNKKEEKKKLINKISEWIKYHLENTEQIKLNNVNNVNNANNANNANNTAITMEEINNCPIMKTICNKLNTYRNGKAEELNKKKYNIFTDKVRNEIVRLKPDNKKNLRKITGIGVKFIENYSDDVLKIIQNSI